MKVGVFNIYHTFEYHSIPISLLDLWLSTMDHSVPGPGSCNSFPGLPMKLWKNDRGDWNLSTVDNTDCWLLQM